MVFPDEAAAHVEQGESGDDGHILEVIFVRMASPAWVGSDLDRDEAMLSTKTRVLTRTDSKDNADVATDPSGGIYVNTGATTLYQTE